MASILIKNVPKPLKEHLQREAERNRRSLNQQVLSILEQASAMPHVPLPNPIKPRKPFTHEWLMKVIREGRE